MIAARAATAAIAKRTGSGIAGTTAAAWSRKLACRGRDPNRILPASPAFARCDRRRNTATAGTVNAILAGGCAIRYCATGGIAAVSATARTAAAHGSTARAASGGRAVSGGANAQRRCRTTTATTAR
ncbi:hypothetical protein U1701_00105 [Sphingomonas sp. PB2P19]|uniref:hypothetical protein n=1 Tax=Sphingomonas rhamnosi TaxID=3096156 RepID=UPI002FC5C933